MKSHKQPFKMSRKATTPTRKFRQNYEAINWSRKPEQPKPCNESSDFAPRDHQRLFAVGSSNRNTK